MVNIYCNKKDKDLKNFWNHIVFHPTDAIEDEWGKRILDKAAEDGAVRTVRIYTMMEDIFTLDGNGNICADYKLNDYRIDYLLSKGFNILLAYAFLPNWLCEKPDFASAASRVGKRYKGKMVCNSRAADYSKWEEICRQYTRHIVDRYGEETVAKWRIHCYNEPDASSFFYKDAPSEYARAEEYCKMYDAFEAGITSVSKKIPIGGPALSESVEHLEFYKYFLDHIKKTNRKFDFISIHSYGTEPGMITDGSKPISVNGALRNTMTLVRIAKMCGFEDLPIVCDEWGATTGGHCGIEDFPGLMFRDSEICSAYFAKMIMRFDELNVPYDEMMICLSGQHDLPTEFPGYRNFFTLNFYPKPIYNSFVLAGKLGEEKLHYFVNWTTQHLSVMPTKHKDGHFSVLLAYADGDFRCKIPKIDAPITFRGIDGKYDVVKYVIDKDHANAIEKYRELGCPDNPTEEQKKEIYDFASLKPEPFGTVSAENPSVTVSFEENSVVLLELFPKRD